MSPSTFTLAVATIAVTLVARADPPQFVQIVREPIKAGNELAYAAIEDESTRACAELKCPHPYLALETLGGQKEIWWFNFFDSESDRQRVVSEYAKNRELMEVLSKNSRRKSTLTSGVSDTLLSYRSDLTRSGSWDVAGKRFVAVIIAKSPTDQEGFWFEAPSGKFFVLIFGKNEDEVRRQVQNISDATILMVRPSWGYPERRWIEADLQFWSSNPNAGVNILSR